jgi:hypothetical protein
MCLWITFFSIKETKPKEKDILGGRVNIFSQSVQSRRAGLLRGLVEAVKIDVPRVPAAFQRRLHGQ